MAPAAKTGTNPKQRVLRWLGLVVLVLMGAFPPWKLSYSLNGNQKSLAAGYQAIWSPPSTEQQTPEGASELKYSVDLVRISFQFLIVLGLINTGNYLLRSRNE